MTAKTKVGGGSKNCVAWITEKAKHYFAHTDKVITASFMDQGKQTQARQNEREVAGNQGNL